MNKPAGVKTFRIKINSALRDVEMAKKKLEALEAIEEFDVYIGQQYDLFNEVLDKLDTLVGDVMSLSSSIHGTYR